MNRPHPKVLSETAIALDRRPDVVLLSAYLMHFPSVEAICDLANRRGIPVILGGPMFNLPAVADSWRTMPGLTAIVGGEVDRSLPDIVECAVSKGDLLQFQGVSLPDGRRTPMPAPIRDLSNLPVPDFSDFPWERYRTRVVPLMSGRGCGWGQCSFCSDVIGSSGRTFRTRTVESVLAEMERQATTCRTKNFIFLDIKMNSDVRIWRGIIQSLQSRLPGAQWIGTVHVDDRRDNGLSRDTLREAAASGLRRMSFGLESGSQRVLDLMRKGCNVERNSEFIRNASEAGISVRCTMIQGFPGESSSDLDKSAVFLEDHYQHIDRVQLNNFSLLLGTAIHTEISEIPSRYPQLRVLQQDSRNGRASYEYLETGHAEYRKAKRRLLSLVHRINRRPLQRCSAEFDGLM